MQTAPDPVKRTELSNPYHTAHMPGIAGFEPFKHTQPQIRNKMQILERKKRTEII